MTNALEGLARQAIAGDRDALDRLVRALQADVYGLALRMLWNREDAEDATQEILVRTVTRLAQFDFRSALKTWASTKLRKERSLRTGSTSSITGLDTSMPPCVG